MPEIGQTISHHRIIEKLVLQNWFEELKRLCPSGK
jgi:hypothetical protein